MKFRFLAGMILSVAAASATQAQTTGTFPCPMPTFFGFYQYNQPPLPPISTLQTGFRGYWLFGMQGPWMYIPENVVISPGVVRFDARSYPRDFSQPQLTEPIGQLPAGQYTAYVRPVHDWPVHGPIVYCPVITMSFYVSEPYQHTPVPAGSTTGWAALLGLAGLAGLATLASQRRQQRSRTS